MFGVVREGERGGTAISIGVAIDCSIFDCGVYSGHVVTTDIGLAVYDSTAIIYRIDVVVLCACWLGVCLRYQFMSHNYYFCASWFMIMRSKRVRRCCESSDHRSREREEKVHHHPTTSTMTRSIA